MDNLNIFKSNKLLVAVALATAADSHHVPPATLRAAAAAPGSALPRGLGSQARPGVVFAVGLDRKSKSVSNVSSLFDVFRCFSVSEAHWSSASQGGSTASATCCWTSGCGGSGTSSTGSETSGSEGKLGVRLAATLVEAKFIRP